MWFMFEKKSSWIVFQCWKTSVGFALLLSKFLCYPFSSGRYAQCCAPFSLSPYYLFVSVNGRSAQAQQASLRWDLGLLRAVVYFMGPHLLPSAARLIALLQSAFSIPSRVRSSLCDSLAPFSTFWLQYAALRSHMELGTITAGDCTDAHLSSTSSSKALSK